MLDSRYLEQIVPLTEEQVWLVKATFKLLKVENFGPRFYAYLFQEYPQLKELYIGNLRETGTRFFGVIDLTVNSFREEETGKYFLEENLHQPLRELGKRHLKFGVESSFYVVAVDIFVTTIHDELGDEYTPEIESSWRLLFQHLAFYMNQP